MQKRIGKRIRKTKETEIAVELNLDGKEEPRRQIKTGIDLLDHMFDLFAFHGLFDLKLLVEKSDLKIDFHHTVEDIGITLGEALKEALGDKKGIKRFGSARVPMDDVVAEVAVDLSGRFAFNFRRREAYTEKSDEKSSFSWQDAKNLFESFAKKGEFNLDISVSGQGDLHHVLEAIFKALGIALDEATQIDPRRKDTVPSTKGTLT